MLKAFLGRQSLVEWHVSVDVSVVSSNPTIGSCLFQIQTQMRQDPCDPPGMSKVAPIAVHLAKERAILRVDWFYRHQIVRVLHGTVTSVNGSRNESEMTMPSMSRI